ncbi:MAG TPA: DUF1003 domain-containing protein [Microbacteriaceae bacterium]|nr:DUF1003 domain-containing protein [Microbacteriaceae bacterium]
MARSNSNRLDIPRGLNSAPLNLGRGSRSDRFGRFSESFARAMGTSRFLIGMSVFVVLWLVWNTWGPSGTQFDSAELGYTVLTLILSLQASYAAPLILLAQNRQDDRDRVQIEQDRQRAERNLADTEYLAREVVALRLAMKEVVTKDVLRAELRALLESLEERDEQDARAAAEHDER